jgi:hypothetical protein
MGRDDDADGGFDAGGDVTPLASLTPADQPSCTWLWCQTVPVRGPHGVRDCQCFDLGCVPVELLAYTCNPKARESIGKHDSAMRLHTLVVFAPKGQALLPLAVRNFKLLFLKCAAIHSMARQSFQKLTRFRQR